MRHSSLGFAAAMCVILAACCDIPSVLYDTAGTVVCAPDGGFIGRGDGRCPDFISQRSNEKVFGVPVPPNMRLKLPARVD